VLVNVIHREVSDSALHLFRQRTLFRETKVLVSWVEALLAALAVMMVAPDSVRAPK
jgi:hypothetical protein